MKTMKLKYLGRTPRTFPLPIPFLAKSSQTGSVRCSPPDNIGEFPEADALNLLGVGEDPVDGAAVMFERVIEKNGDVVPMTPPAPLVVNAELEKPKRVIKRRKRRKKRVVKSLASVKEATDG